MSDNISAPDPDGWAKEFVQTVRHVIPAKRRMPDPTALALAIVMAAKKKPARNGGWQETCIIDTDRPENVIPFIHDAARARKASDGADPQPGPFPPDPEQPGTPPQGDISDGRRPTTESGDRTRSPIPVTTTSTSKVARLGYSRASWRGARSVIGSARPVRSSHH